MTDRLPVPLEDLRRARSTERASATPRFSGHGALAAGTGRRAKAGATTLLDAQRLMLSGISGSEQDAELASSLLTDGPRSSARERLDVYRIGYRGRLVECLVDDYPVLSEALGQERFEVLCEAYLERHPSSSPNLNPFGRHMAELCRGADPELVQAVFETETTREFCSDLAALEWALVEAIHAPASPSFDLGALQAVPPDRVGDVRLVPSGSGRILRFGFPVNVFYQACRRSGEVPAVPGPSPSATAVYRKGFTIWRMDLTPAMARVLTALLERSTIAESLARIGVDESDPAALGEAERSVMVWFREWVQSGFFSGVEIQA